MPHIWKLREHPVLDFAYSEWQTMITAARKDVKDDIEQWIIGTWHDCEEHLASSTDHAWPWTAEGMAVYDQDAFVVIEHNNRVIFTGKNERATLYAVYQYARDRLNMAWIYPGEEAISTVGIDRDVELGTIIEPAFQRRGFVYETLKDEAYLTAVVDWLAKNKLNELFLTFSLWHHLRDALLPELEKRGTALTLGGHSMQFFTEAIRSLGLNADGSAPAFVGKKQLDYADESWQNKIIDDIIEYCRSIPMLTRISLWPEDTAVSGQGANGEADPFLQLYIRFSERLQAALIRAGMNIQVEHIAYNAGLSWEMLELPESMESSARIDTLFAYWGRDYSQRWLDVERSAEKRANRALSRWNEQTASKQKQLTIFEYYSDHFMLSYMFPHLSKRIYDDLQYYRSIGIRAIVNLVVPYPQADETYSWKWAQSMNSYVFARAAWGDAYEHILEDYKCCYPENHREEAFKLLEHTGKLCSKLSYYNVPLFPSRVVDMAEVPDHLREEIINILGEIISFLDDVIPSIDVPDMETQSLYHQYYSHLYRNSQKLIKQFQPL